MAKSRIINPSDITDDTLVRISNKNPFDAKNNAGEFTTFKNFRERVGTINIPPSMAQGLKRVDALPALNNTEGRRVWLNNTIPASGVVKRDLTITPVGWATNDRKLTVGQNSGGTDRGINRAGTDTYGSLIDQDIFNGYGYLRASGTATNLIISTIRSMWNYPLKLRFNAIEFDVPEGIATLDSTTTLNGNNIDTRQITIPVTSIPSLSNFWTGLSITNADEIRFNIQRSNGSWIYNNGIWTAQQNYSSLSDLGSITPADDGYDFQVQYIADSFNQVSNRRRINFNRNVGKFDANKTVSHIVINGIEHSATTSNFFGGGVGFRTNNIVFSEPVVPYTLNLKYTDGSYQFITITNPEYKKGIWTELLNGGSSTEWVLTYPLPPIINGSYVLQATRLNNKVSFEWVRKT